MYNKNVIFTEGKRCTIHRTKHIRTTKNNNIILKRHKTMEYTCKFWKKKTYIYNEEDEIISLKALVRFQLKLITIIL